MEKEQIRAGDIEVISVNKEAEVPYELVARYDASGNRRLFTRNIRDAEGEAEQKENIAKKLFEEAEKAKEEAEKAKKRAASKKQLKKEE